MNRPLQDALKHGESILVVYAHGGEYSGQRFQNDYDVSVAYYTPPGQCIYGDQLKRVVAAMRSGDVPENAGGRDTKLKVDNSSIANTSFTFHDDSEGVESMVGLQFGLYLLKATGLTRCQVNLTQMTNMCQIHEHACSLGIHYVVQLSCKATTAFAQLTGTCSNPRCNKGVIPLKPSCSPINVLLNMQCRNCLGCVTPSTLEVGQVSWSMNLTVLHAPTGTLRRHHVPMQKSTGTAGCPQRHELQVSPGVKLSPDDTMRELVITLST